MDQSRERIRTERRRQEMTNSDPSLLHPGSFGVWRQMGGGGGGGVRLGLHVVHIAQLVPESWLQHTQDLLDVT